MLWMSAMGPSNCSRSCAYATALVQRCLGEPDGLGGDTDAPARQKSRAPRLALALVGQPIPRGNPDAVERQARRVARAQAEFVLRLAD